MKNKDQMDRKKGRLPLIRVYRQRSRSNQMNLHRLDPYYVLRPQQRPDGYILRTPHSIVWLVIQPIRAMLLIYTVEIALFSQDGLYMVDQKYAGILIGIQKDSVERWGPTRLDPLNYIIRRLFILLRD